MMDSYKWGDSWSARRALHSEKKKFRFWTKKIFEPPPQKHNTFTSYKSKYLSNGKLWIVTSGVIRDQLDELYIVKKEKLILDKE